jgi:hypothetical protein
MNFGIRFAGKTNDDEVKSMRKRIMMTKETTSFPFLLGTILIMALVIFLSMFNHDAAASGIYPGNSAIALLNLLF